MGRNLLKLSFQGLGTGRHGVMVSLGCQVAWDPLRDYFLEGFT